MTTTQKTPLQRLALETRNHEELRKLVLGYVATHNGRVREHDVIFLTQLGDLCVSIHDDWIACRFVDVSRAIKHFGENAGVNRFTGKWNWGCGEKAKAADLFARWSAAVDKLLPTISSRIIEVGVRDYTAVVTTEEKTPWGLCITWDISREGAVVGRMFQNPPSYPDRVICSMTKLVWAGTIPPGAADPKSAEYGICFDTGPCDSLEKALEEFARRADRLIAWRKDHASNVI